MKKLLSMLMLMFTFHLYASDIQPLQNSTKMSANMPKLLEVVLTLPFENLIVNGDGISVNYEGNLLAVHSLERNGSEWIVRASGYCGNGHRVVCRCGGCAVSSCGYCCSCCNDNYKKPS